MNINVAQTLVLSFFDRHDCAGRRSYKAPHAPQPTPNRAHRSRNHWDAQRFSIYRGARPPVFGGRV